MMARAKVGDPLTVVPDSTWERMSRIEPGAGPRCHLCNRLMRDGDRSYWVATDCYRDRFAVAVAGMEHAGEIRVGAECLRRYVPRESIIGTAEW
jgi:hypothetical protein